MSPAVMTAARSHVSAVAAAFLFLVTFALAPASRADSIARFSVGAVVKSRVTMNTLAARRELQVTAEDIARGSIDIPVATQIEVSSNNPEGYVLNVQPQIALFTHAQIVGLDSIADIGSDGATIVQRGQLQHTTRVSIGYRFFLAPGLVPGTYPWPVQVSVAPLAS